jgi:ribosomal protein S18 acetylase RimI-like enzyme
MTRHKDVNSAATLELTDNYKLRDFQSTDAETINHIALSAFKQYEKHYSDWPRFSKNIANMAALAEYAELIVATVSNKIVGAVAYAPPGKPKQLFPIEWPIIRMLVVDSAFRGTGIGKSLTEACINRALRDTSPLIALHTSPIMKVALSMYLKMGFIFQQETSPIYGVPYGIYIKKF